MIHRSPSFMPLLLIACLGLACAAVAPPTMATPDTPVIARVVALDSVIYLNRLGATIPGGTIFALKEDVEPIKGSSSDPDDWTTWQPGEVQLKDYKRARPIVLRVNKGEQLQVEFRNLLAKTPVTIPCNETDPTKPASDQCSTGQSNTRAVGVHIQGMNWASSSQDDGSWVGQNSTSFSNPGDPVRDYYLLATEEGTFVLYSNADNITFGNIANQNTGGGDGGQMQTGLFGALTVEPEVAEYYRSQVNHEDICLASKDGRWDGKACKRAKPESLPQIDYQALYPDTHPRAGLPILNMQCNTAAAQAGRCTAGELVHSDLTAIITGPNAGAFPKSMATLPEFHDVAVSPNRLEPYREFTIIYHEVLRVLQAFAPIYNANQLSKAMESGNDNFAINYGTGGIASEILSNRMGVGPMSECTDCKYEEFFLSSWPNGDPAMVADKAADSTCSGGDNGNYTTFQCAGGDPATMAFYPDDPSNVYHGYLWDHTKFRVLHGGSDLHHLHHLHAHQWLKTPNTSDSHYLDSQAIGPGFGFTSEMVYNGGGNKNLTVGDSIFHCHFYPHFAAGMWALWRVHDVFETGTELNEYPQGTPVTNARALPDGEIVAGTPIPAIVPLPTKAMAPVPAPARLDPTSDGREVQVCTDYTYSNCVSNLAASNTAYIQNPGYPFFIPGIGGSRAPHPPLDFSLACTGDGSPCSNFGDSCGTGGTCDYLDGGLPRHVVQPGGDTHSGPLNPINFSKDVEKADAVGLPEDGTGVEQVAMKFHASLDHQTQTPEGNPAEFRTNGNPPMAGAPYAEPCIDLDGTQPSPQPPMRDYWAVDIQLDAVFNESGWHFPQQRVISLWGDAFDFLGLTPNKPQKAPEPFFFRANSNDCVMYNLANLVPKTYELDDFEVRTPTDILGQHIHLVKFDVTSSDGAANGFNYEDGTLAPDEVIERINAFNQGTFQPPGGQPVSGSLKPKFIQFFGADPECPLGESGTSDAAKCNCDISGGYVRGGRWCGAQSTVQRWYVDPQLTDQGNDRTMRTVFTHDHFGPSTHQQAGLYAGLIAEPQGSVWLDNETGTPMGGAGVPSRMVQQNGVDLADGGPTSWQAIIQTQDMDASYREFLFEFQDTVLMYQPFDDQIANHQAPGCPAGWACGFCSNDHNQVCVTDQSSPLYYGTVCKSVTLPIPNTGGATTQLDPSCNFVPGIPSNKNLFFADTDASSNIWGVTTSSTELPSLQKIGWETVPIDPPPDGLAASGNPAQPELISFNGGTNSFSLNYRNEPLYSRIFGTSTNANSDNFAYVYASLDRQVAGFDPPSYPPLTSGVEPGDPFTPLLRAYAGDNVQIRTLVGAHQNPHNLTIHGTRWLAEPSWVNSGWRASQIMGISEHFEMLFQLPVGLGQPDAQTPTKPWTDYLYRTSNATKPRKSGSWGLMRTYDAKQADLAQVPGNTPPDTAPSGPGDLPVCPQMTQGQNGWELDCAASGVRCYDVVASTAKQALQGGTLIYNSRGTTAQTTDAILFFLESDRAGLKNGSRKPEPLVLRAAAGECIKVNLSNEIDPANLGPDSRSGQLPVGYDPNNPNSNLNQQATTSSSVALSPQLVSYDVRQSDGTNAGFNPVQTADPGGSVTYYWYAGNIDPAGATKHIPIEFGGANLLPPDPVNHHAYGLFGALIIEPQGSRWFEDPQAHTQATVRYTDSGGTTRFFREFVALVQDETVIRNNAGTRMSNWNGLNYASERLNGQRTCLPSGNTSVDCILSSLAAQCTGNGSSGNCNDPQTPIFCAAAGDQVRFRWLHPGGGITNEIMEVFGHVYAEEPYLTASSNCQEPITQTNPFASQFIEVGNQCPDGNVALGPTLSEWLGSRMGHGPTNHYEMVIDKAGGQNGIAGDYLYRTYQALRFGSGIWGLFRVLGKDCEGNTSGACACPSGYTYAPLSSGGG